MTEIDKETFYRSNTIGLAEVKNKSYRKQKLIFCELIIMKSKSQSNYLIVILEFMAFEK